VKGAVFESPGKGLQKAPCGERNFFSGFVFCCLELVLFTDRLYDLSSAGKL
jgi:hypothetical protein